MQSRHGFFFLLAVAAASPVWGQAGQSGPPSLVSVTDSRFAAGCPNAADPLGHQDSTCAVRAALHFAESSGLPGGGFPVLYFPHGVYKVAGQGFTSALTVTRAISIQGAGEASTVLLNTSPRAATLTYLKANSCSGMPDACPITIQNITFLGQGHATAGGLIELDSTINGTMRNVALAETGGIALNLQGASERWYFTDMEISHARWAVVLQGDTNEDYFERVNVISPGSTQDYCYSVDCPGGRRIDRGTWYPDPHSAVYLDGDNVHWADSSIKSTDSIGGIRLSPVDSSVTHTYIEGYPWGGQPRANHAIAAPGPEELGHLSAAIGAHDLSIPVDDAQWQPLYINDPAQAQVNGNHAYDNAYGIFPADYIPFSKEPSRAVPGITRGTMETVDVAAFSGDGRAHLIARGKQPIAWPSGSVIEQAAPSAYGNQVIEGNHLNSLDPYFSARYPSGCSDTAQRKDWTSSPSELCAEVIAGAVPDGFMVPFPTQTFVRAGFGIVMAYNGIFTGGSEQDGQGWVKIPGNAGVEIEGGDAPLRTFVDADTALHRYVNGNTKVQVVQWPGVQPASALAYVVDPGAGVRFSPQEGFYSAEVMHNGVLDHQYLNSRMGPQCWYNTTAGSPDHRTCSGPDGFSADILTGGRWITSASSGHPAVQPAGNAVKYVIRDWNVNTLAATGHEGDCASREVSTGAVRFSTAADATLIVNLSPNPGAAAMASAAITGDGTHAALRICNTGDAPVRWETPPLVTLTQLP